MAMLSIQRDQPSNDAGISTVIPLPDIMTEEGHAFRIRGEIAWRESAAQGSFDSQHFIETVGDFTRQHSDRVVQVSDSEGPPIESRQVLKPAAFTPPSFEVGERRLQPRPGSSSEARRPSTHHDQLVGILEGELVEKNAVE
jgi:hypothetical protein